MTKNKTSLIIGGLLLIIVVGLLFINFILFSSPQPKSQKQEVFTIALKSTEPAIINKLKVRALFVTLGHLTWH
ncbi:MAG: hypothetical protein WC895_02180 [Candidatus Shapirobacteria bacterium]|jgi:cell division protein YceG involved in septum cleavage